MLKLACKSASFNVYFYRSLNSARLILDTVLRRCQANFLLLRARSIHYFYQLHIRGLTQWRLFGVLLRDQLRPKSYV